jgi:hypothetical protein
MIFFQAVAPALAQVDADAASELGEIFNMTSTPSASYEAVVEGLAPLVKALNITSAELGKVSLAGAGPSAAAACGRCRGAERAGAWP